MANNTVAYDPGDAVQQRFLSALALGETGGGTGSAFVGTGGIDLSNAPTDANGFPLWGGNNNSHAAGTFQFQPSTWADLADRFGLNFHNPDDQAAGAWYLAEETYARQTGHSLEADLAAGNTGLVQSALASVWPSVTGNGAAPQGLAASIANGLGGSTGSAVGSSAGASSGGSGVWGSVVQLFQRSGLIIVGGIIVLVALWSLLASQSSVPGPGDVAKGIGEAVA